MPTNRYVSKTGSNVAPYLTWETAATTIQVALNVALADDTVWVWDGTYFENITIGRYVTLRSRTGIPTDVVIDGGHTNRVATMTDITSWVIGITIANGKVTSGGEPNAGAGTRYGTLSNCIISGNISIGTYLGAGCYGGVLYNCLLIGNYNSSNAGGGAYSAILYNCTIVKNSATSYGGVHECNIYNCISYLNTPNADRGPTPTCSCGPGYTGAGNINATTNPPQFVGDTDYHLQQTSPCIDAGTLYSWMTDPADPRSKDLDGNPRLHNDVADMGAYENQFSDFSSSSSSSSLSSSSSSFSSVSSSSLSSSSFSSMSFSSLSSVSSSSSEHHLDPPYDLVFVANVFERKITISWKWDNPGHLIAEPTGFTIGRRIGTNPWEELSCSIPPEDRSYEDVLSEENAALVFAYGNPLSYRIRAFLVD